MAWSETGTEVVTDIRQFWIVEWAEYNQEFIDTHGTVSGANEGDRVWRKLVAQDADTEWRGMTWAAAGTKVATLVQGASGSEYQGARTRRLPGGGGNVYATRRTYDPSGWSAWDLESTFPNGVTGTGA